MLKRIILLIFAVIIVGQLYLLREGRKTMNELEKLKELSEQRVDSLRLANDSIDIFTDVLVLQVDSLGREINADEKQLQKIKNDYKKRIDSISKLSSNELTEYFSNRYNNN
jgi:ribosome recycling factor